MFESYKNSFNFAVRCGYPFQIKIISTLQHAPTIPLAFFTSFSF